MPKWRPISIQHDFYTPFICVTMSDQIDSKARTGSRAKTMPFIVGLAPINCLISKRTPSKRWLHTMALYEGVKICVFIERQNADFVIFWVTFNSWSIGFSTATRGCKPITKLIVSVPNTNKNPKTIWIFLIIDNVLPTFTPTPEMNVAVVVFPEKSIVQMTMLYEHYSFCISLASTQLLNLSSYSRHLTNTLFFLRFNTFSITYISLFFTIFCISCS